MTFADEQDRERRPKSAPSPDGQSTESRKSRKKSATTPEVGHALRAAYQQTINEDIPPDLLDLLGKLG